MKLLFCLSASVILCVAIWGVNCAWTYHQKLEAIYYMEELDNAYDYELPAMDAHHPKYIRL